MAASKMGKKLAAVAPVIEQLNRMHPASGDALADLLTDLVAAVAVKAKPAKKARNGAV